MEEYKGDTNEETQKVISFSTVNINKYHQTFPLKIQIFFLILFTSDIIFNQTDQWLYIKTNQKLLMFFRATFFSPFVSVETVKSVRYLLNLYSEIGI